MFWGGGSIFYNPIEHDYSKDYLTFIPITDGTFSINRNGSGTTSNTISYSIGDGNWTNIGYGVQTPTVQAGQKIRFKGTPDASYIGNEKSIGTFQCTTSFDAEGNAISMTHGDNFQSATAMESECELAALFSGSSIISAENVVLPAISLTNGCYFMMFRDCTGLTTAPALPAMTLASDCYSGMFYGCTNLNSITCLATNISAEGCTTNWVNGVAATGTFTKAASMTSWTTGVRGIPSGWTVVDKQ